MVAGAPELRTVTCGTSTIIIGRGAAAVLPGWLRGRLPASRLILVTDANVGSLHAAAIGASLRAAGFEVLDFQCPAGEVAKTRETKARIEDAMVAWRIGRDDALLALGGGVVSDLAGFVAATWMRGIPWCAIPTTLLGMVDASVGGKTGVDHPSGKNMIGAFHPPLGIFADTGMLDTLPDRELRQGLAECVKAGVVGDAPLFALLSTHSAAIGGRDPELLIDIITRACSVKAAIVAGDERESDRRKILNFGHTVGHAIEMASGWAMAHGDAVSIGMVIESRLASSAGLLDREVETEIARTLSALGLPVSWPETRGGISPEDLLAAARHDKKNRGGRLVFALPAAIGTMARGVDGYGIAFDEDVVLEAIAPFFPARSGRGAPGAAERPGGDRAEG